MVYQKMANFAPVMQYLKPALRHLYLLLPFWAACNAPGAPLDADTRLYIDSTVVAQSRRAQAEIDSLCRLSRNTELPRLVDSLKRHRLQEIEEKLKTIPKQ
jgi:hypothetical protein